MPSVWRRLRVKSLGRIHDVRRSPAVHASSQVRVGGRRRGSVTRYLTLTTVSFASPSLRSPGATKLRPGCDVGCLLFNRRATAADNWLRLRTSGGKGMSGDSTHRLSRRSIGTTGVVKPPRPRLHWLVQGAMEFAPHARMIRYPLQPSFPLSGRAGPFAIPLQAFS